MSTRQLSRELAGHSTQILLQVFADRVFVLVTQLGKVGTLIQASIPDTAPLMPASDQKMLPAPSPAIQLTPLLGSSPSEHMQTLYSLYAAQIATIVWTHSMQASRRSVVVGLALKKYDGIDDGAVAEQEKDLFHGVMSSLQELLSRQ